MLIQNQYDGRLYEVPESPVGGYGEYAGPGYRGLGIPFLAPLAARAAARFLPKALPFARRLLQRLSPGVPGIPGAPVIPTARLSTSIAQKVVAMLRQQGFQLAPAGAPQPQPTPAEAPAPAPEPQSGVGEYPYYPNYPPRPSPAAWLQRAYPQQYPYPPRPHAARWVLPNAQYPGAEPRRLYLRCATWWGQPGRVPGPGMPVQPVAPPLPGAPFARAATPPAAAYRRPPYRRRR